MKPKGNEKNHRHNINFERNDGMNGRKRLAGENEMIIKGQKKICFV
jgi:hypothetical protein